MRLEVGHREGWPFRGAGWLPPNSTGQPAQQLGAAPEMRESWGLASLHLPGQGGAPGAEAPSETRVQVLRSTVGRKL